MMEGILALLVMFAIIFAANIVWRAVAAGTSAAARSVRGKGSFGANFDAAFAGMRQMETRLQLEWAGDDSHRFEVCRIQAKGLFPVSYRRELAFAASVLDITDLDSTGVPQTQPVICYLEHFQEPDTICYRHEVQVGSVAPNSGWVDWVSILAFVPETLVPPRSGRRLFQVSVWTYDPHQPLTVRLGFLLEGTPLAAWSHNFEWDVSNEGYDERSERRERAEELIVRLSVAVAFADGVMHDAEGKTIKAWMAKHLQLVSDDNRPKRRERLNGVMREAYADGSAGRLEVSSIVEDLKAVAPAAGCTEAVELCLDVMSADGVADPDELRIVNIIAQRLDVDLERFEELKDKRLAGLASGISSDTDYYALLNMDPTWDADRVRAHLNRLYTQWNARAEAMHDPKERAQAERMLEVIAGAREALVQ